MEKETIQIEPLSLTFEKEGNERKISLPKSQMQLDYSEQLDVITHQAEHLVPLVIEEEEDAYQFTFRIDPVLMTWERLKKQDKKNQLRALCNMARLHRFSSRITIFLHPNNIVFDENLIPKVIFRGIRGLVVPKEMNELDLLKQYKCFTIALFSKDYTFDALYNGALDKVEQQFERKVKDQESMEDLQQLLYDAYRKESEQMKKKMKLVPIKQFRLFKQLSIWVSAAAVLILGLLIYAVFIKIPYEEKQLEATHEFLEEDYGQVIQVLKDENIDKLPFASKYILAYSYVQVEQLSDDEKAAIMKNISLKSDTAYLKYWIFNGLGDFDESIDLAKYMDDPQLIMYSLIQRIDQVKNDPDIDGEEREDEINRLHDQLEKYTEEYELLEDGDEEVSGEEKEAIPAAGEEAESEKDSSDEEEDKEKEKDKDKKKDKKEKKKK